VRIAVRFVCAIETLLFVFAHDFPSRRPSNMCTASIGKNRYFRITSMPQIRQVPKIYGTTHVANQENLPTKKKFANQEKICQPPKRDERPWLLRKIFSHSRHICQTHANGIQTRRPETAQYTMLFGPDTRLQRRPSCEVLATSSCRLYQCIESLFCFWLSMISLFVFYVLWLCNMVYILRWY